jgi:hypothetical protein
MTNPISFETSWTEAEHRAFGWLVEISGSTEGRSAFLGRNPGIVNAWAFEPQTVTDIGESVLLAHDLPSLGIPYRAAFASLVRASCQEWAMRVIGGLPLCRDAQSNVALFRVRSLGEIIYGPAEIAAANERKTVDVWTMEIGFDLVFTTGGKANTVGGRP